MKDRCFSGFGGVEDTADQFIQVMKGRRGAAIFDRKEEGFDMAFSRFIGEAAKVEDIEFDRAHQGNEQAGMMDLIEFFEVVLQRAPQPWGGHHTDGIFKAQEFCGHEVDVHRPVVH